MGKDEVLKICLSNKSGYYLKGDNFKKFFPKEYEDMNKIDFPEDFSFTQKVYHYLHDDFYLKIGICVCGKRCKFISLNAGYKKHCSVKCSVNDKAVIEKKEKTTLKKYGVKNCFQSESIKDKIKKVNLEKYGVEHASCSDIVKDKVKKTCLERYGVDSALKNKEVREKIKKTNLEKYGVSCSLFSDVAKEKTKKTILERYGVEFITQSSEIIEKIKSTNLKKYGVEHALQSEVFMEKYKKTNLARYGAEFTLQSKELSKRISNTILKKYGVDNISKNRDIREKVKNTLLTKYGVEYAFFLHKTDDGKIDYKKYKTISKTNLRFSNLLKKEGINHKMEQPIKNRCFDFLLYDNLLIEIDPMVTHNVVYNIFGEKPMSNNYHKEKSQLAKDQGLFCIHIWDWDDSEKIARTLKTRENYNNDNILISLNEKNECCEFLDDFSFSEYDNDFDVCVSLRIDDVIESVITLKKINNCEWIISNFTNKFYFEQEKNIRKLVNWFIENFSPNKIYYACDNSKINSNIFTNIGFVVKHNGTPMLHWFDGHKHYIDENVLSYKDNTYFNDNENDYKEIIENGFLPLFDCGNDILVYDIK